VARLEQVDRIPTVLALLLAVLGALAVGHLLMASARRRRRDLAVLKTLGFTRRQVMTTVVWQAVTVAAFGIVVGAAFGIAAGSWLWRTTAEDVGVVADVAPRRARRRRVSGPRHQHRRRRHPGPPRRRPARSHPAAQRVAAARSTSQLPVEHDLGADVTSPPQHPANGGRRV
jgi:hypothetical protein